MVKVFKKSWRHSIVLMRNLNHLEQINSMIINNFNLMEETVDQNHQLVEEPINLSLKTNNSTLLTTMSAALIARSVVTFCDQWIKLFKIVLISVSFLINAPVRMKSFGRLLVNYKLMPNSTAPSLDVIFATGKMRRWWQEDSYMIILRRIVRKY